MTVDVNLLPMTYHQARRREHWIQRGSAIGITLVLAELVVGFMLYCRAGDERSLREGIAKTRANGANVKTQVDTMAVEATQVRKNLVLAKQLRATHRWSLLLGALAQATPEGVVLSAINTQPTKWTRPRTSPQPLNAPKARKDEPKPPPETPIDAIVITGHAGDHEALAKLTSNLHKAGIFANIDLRKMARDQINREQAQSILSAQINRYDRLSLADDIINNDGSISDLQAQVDELHRKYLGLAAKAS